MRVKCECIQVERAERYINKNLDVLVAEVDKTGKGVYRDDLQGMSLIMLINHYCGLGWDIVSHTQNLIGTDSIYTLTIDIIIFKRAVE
jgi:hypothetical protein